MNKKRGMPDEFPQLVGAEHGRAGYTRRFRLINRNDRRGDTDGEG